MLVWTVSELIVGEAGAIVREVGKLVGVGSIVGSARAAVKLCHLALSLSCIPVARQC